MSDLPTLEAALKLADQDCPLPSLAGPALKVLRERVRQLNNAQPALAMDVGMAERVLSEYVRICIDQHHDDAPVGARVDAMRKAIIRNIGNAQAAWWMPIETAPKDGTPVLVWLRPAGELPLRAQHYADLQFVARNTGDYAEWSFAAPVGVGGFPDSWLWRWSPLPPKHDKEMP